MFKFLVVLAVLLAAAGALWWSGLLSQWVPAVPTYQALMGANATTTPEAPQTQNDAQQQAVNDLPTQANDASDEALDKDAAALDAQLQVLASDNSSAQDSLNDKPVSQEY